MAAQVEKNAIKDIITDDYSDEDSSSEDSDEYTRLRDEFNSEFLLKKALWSVNYTQEIFSPLEPKTFSYALYFIVNLFQFIPFSLRL